jgi:hypothetical protein
MDLEEEFKKKEKEEGRCIQCERTNTKILHEEKDKKAERLIERSEQRMGSRLASILSVGLVVCVVCVGYVEYPKNFLHVFVFGGWGRA